MPTIDQLYTPREAAQLLRVSHFTLNRLRDDGALPAVRVRGQVRYRAADLAALIAENLEKRGPAANGAEQERRSGGAPDGGL